jgi:hypothetical protein
VANRVLQFGISHAVIPACAAPCHAVLRGSFANPFADRFSLMTKVERLPSNLQNEIATRVGGYISLARTAKDDATLTRFIEAAAGERAQVAQGVRRDVREHRYRSLLIEAGSLVPTLLCTANEIHPATCSANALCRMIRLRPISWLPRISLGLTIAQLSARLRCAECGRGLAAQTLCSDRSPRHCRTA